MHIGIEAPGHAALGAAPPSEADRPSAPGVAWACLRNLAILALWSWLFRPSLAHLAQLAGEDHLRSSAWALAGALALVLRQARLGGLRPRLDAPLRGLDDTDPLGLIVRLTLREAGVRGRNQRAVVDQVAAVAILQGWLDQRRSMPAGPATESEDSVDGTPRG